MFRYNSGSMTVENAQKLLEALAPDKWVELSNAVKTACLNARTIHVEFVESPTSLIVKRIENGWAPKTLSLAFNSANSRIEWKCCDPRPQSGIVNIRLYGRDAFFVVNEMNH